MRLLNKRCSQTGFCLTSGELFSDSGSEINTAIRKQISHFYDFLKHRINLAKNTAFEEQFVSTIVQKQIYH